MPGDLSCASRGHRLRFIWRACRSAAARAQSVSGHTLSMWCPNNRGTVSGGECRKYDSVNLVTQYAFRHHCATTCRVDSQGCEPPPPPRARAPSPGRAISSPPPYAERPQCTLGPWALRTLACYLARSGAPTFPLLLLYHPPCRRWNLSTNTGARTTQHSIDAGTWM